MNTVAAARTASTAPTSSVSAVSFTPPAALLSRHGHLLIGLREPATRTPIAEAPHSRRSGGPSATARNYSSPSQRQPSSHPPKPTIAIRSASSTPLFDQFGSRASCQSSHSSAKPCVIDSSPMRINPGGPARDFRSACGRAWRVPRAKENVSVGPRLMRCSKNESARPWRPRDAPASAR
jgi:hypothetical protein